MRAVETSILKFITGSEKAFVIPPFQRNYSWEEKECCELFDDIIFSCETKKSHYLGNITYYEGEKSGASFSEYILVDGQQRITTILILLCAIRDLMDEEKKKASLNSQYLINEHSENYRIRLKQTASDANSFETLIDGNPQANNSNVMTNYYYFQKRIKASGKSPTDIFEAIIKLEIVEVNLQVTNDLGIVQTIFEKINSSGKRLDAADLIRNLLLLSSTAKIQERLHKNYWLKIEEHLKSSNSSESISRFARDFLIMKTFNFVPKDEILAYQVFKIYFKNESSDNETVLSEMLKFSQYYSWIINEKPCPDIEINRYIQMLNTLKSVDLYPLCLFLLESMFNDQRQELRNIFALLTNFMIRYRIVKPSGGGNDLRTAILNLLRKIGENEIQKTYDAILFELSNSTTEASRFPNNDEFKKQLMHNVNTTYARVLFLELEKNETRNVPVDISQVTIEHLMPQTRTPWWIANLGGEEKASVTYDTYLDCIGNLTPVSQGYNSAMSNSPWNDKLTILEAVQFAITSEIASTYSTWTQADIIKRNEEIADRAVAAITGPIVRTRPITAKSTDDYIPGTYPLSDTSTLMMGSEIDFVEINGTKVKCSRWMDLLVIVSSELIKRNHKLFESIVKENRIHKSTSKKTGKQKDPILSLSRELFNTPLQIGDTAFYCEGNLSSDMSRKYAKQLLEHFRCLEDFSITIK